MNRIHDDKCRNGMNENEYLDVFDQLRIYLRQKRMISDILHRNMNVSRSRRDVLEETRKLVSFFVQPDSLNQEFRHVRRETQGLSFHSKSPPPTSISIPPPPTSAPDSTSPYPLHHSPHVHMAAVPYASANVGNRERAEKQRGPEPSPKIKQNKELSTTSQPQGSLNHLTIPRVPKPPPNPEQNKGALKHLPNSSKTRDLNHLPIQDKTRSPHPPPKLKQNKGPEQNKAKQRSLNHLPNSSKTRVPKPPPNPEQNKGPSTTSQTQAKQGALNHLPNSSKTRDPQPPPNPKEQRALNYLTTPRVPKPPPNPEQNKGTLNHLPNSSKIRAQSKTWVPKPSPNPEQNKKPPNTSQTQAKQGPRAKQRSLNHPPIQSKTRGPEPPPNPEQNKGP
ncbi:uncharacterized protein [Penaeus vannamei]|uniref:uncharacterized protein n=1 Tax=Penaeus vannamei TaxID=6689 RepID=UPI00387F5C24